MPRRADARLVMMAPRGRNSMLRDVRQLERALDTKSSREFESQLEELERAFERDAAPPVCSPLVRVEVPAAPPAPSADQHDDFLDQRERRVAAAFQDLAEALRKAPKASANTSPYVPVDVQYRLWLSSTGD